MILRLLAVLVPLAALSALATDENTNCDKACYVSDKGTFAGIPYDYSYMDYACRSRCLLEKEVAKQTGIKSCDIWRFNPNAAAGYFATMKVIEEANKAGRVRDSHACHARVDEVAGGAAAAGAMKTVWENGLAWAKYYKNFNPVAFLISEGAKHFAHCACTNAKYRDFTGGGEGNTVPPANDHFWVSLMRGDGDWAERHGKASNRDGIIDGAKQALKGKYSKRRMGYVSSTGPTTTHGMCEGSVFYYTGTGGESMTRAYEHARDEKLRRCLFDMDNGTDNSDILNRYSYSVWTDGGKWAIRTDARNKKADTQQQALNSLGASPDGKNGSIFSSSRLTVTRMTCHVSSSSSGGISTSEDVIALYSGTGSRSIDKAIKEAKDKGWKSCRFDTSDAAF